MKGWRSFGSKAPEIGEEKFLDVGQELRKESVKHKLSIIFFRSVPVFHSPQKAGKKGTSLKGWRENGIPGETAFKCVLE